LDDDDHWTGGSAYERYIGRWSARVAPLFLDWLGVPKGVRWLDVGCGTGALTAAILERRDPAAVFGVDPSDSFLRAAQARISDPRVRFVAGSAEALPLAAASVDAAVSGLVLNFVADPVAALVEQARAITPGGVVGAYVWDYAGEMQPLRRFWDAAVALDPAARESDEGIRFPIATPDALAQAFASAGLLDVRVRAIDVATDFVGFDDYWEPFLAGTGPAPAYVAALDDHRRAALREDLRAHLPIQADGSIHLIARAWAVAATVPS
jgi:SAM-dependent methyltransferase